MAKSQIDAFNELVVKETIAWPAGCQNGKKEFLDELGLKLPTETHEILLTITMPGGYQVQDIIDALVNWGDTNQMICDSMGYMDDVPYYEDVEVKIS